MHTTTPTRKRSFLKVLMDFFDLHPAASINCGRSQAPEPRGNEATRHMSAHQLDDLGLLPDGARSTERGIIELALRSRRHGC
jgi:hypothetical protein